ncbi:PREDICTED: mediator of RNA polymerase II transcription subunit 27 [Rhagoletis zephyria]|uniref:mediator of RNA polymerase II transcription subunit 27 n=1 Tax=Rhagoletis zephyria TaxID=28612 RepID=UPI00081174F2|nr:PREDICTED: mediator of RNA polymerase II transcription subunit 27 [Rhagoletis zephyria]
MEKINSTLGAVRSLRSSVRQCFEHLADGTSAELAEDNRTKFLLKFQENFNNMNAQLREVESLINGLQAPQTPYCLGQTTYLAQETAPDRQALYSQLVNSYKWIDKVHDHSFLAFNNLNQNNLRRSYTYCSQKRGRIPFTSCNNTDPDHTDKLLSEINLPLTSYQVCRPFGSNVVVIVTISRVLKAAIVCKGVLIEWVTVKGFDETLDPDDLWTESRYEVFRKVQEHTHIAMLHFFSPTLPDLAIKSYMTWLHSYSKLFLEACKRCGKFVSNGLPPTWRDLRTLEPFHEECRNC